MGINTLGRKKSFQLFWILVFVGFAMNSYGQCPTVTNPTQSFCDTEFPTVASLAATDNGGGIRWYANATGGTPLAGTISLNNGEDYFADDDTGTCVRQPVVVTIYTKPTVVAQQQGFCEESVVADLQATGNMIQWYLSPTGGTALDVNTSLINNTFYYASQINPDTGCETSRQRVFVAVRILPPPTGDNVQVLCSTPNPTIADLVVQGTNVVWYPSSTSGVEIPTTTPIIEGQTYYAAETDEFCESITRLDVTVIFNDPNDPGSNGARRICISDVPSTPPFNLFDELGGTPDATGTWTGPLPTTNGNLGTVDISTLTVAGSPYVFSYNVTASVCSAAQSTVTIEVLPLPEATISATSTTICSGASTTININGTPNATVTYTINGGANQSITLNNAGTASINNTYTAGTTFNLISVASAGTPSCSQLLSGAGTTVTINVNPLPTVSVNSPSICAGQTATVTATPGAAGNYLYTWTVPSGATNPGNVATFNTTVAGNYSVIITDNTTTCNSLSASGTVTINPLPTVAVNSATICPGVNATVTATPTPAGTYSYVWTVPTGATNPGNVATFSTQIAGTYSVIITNTVTTCVSLSGSGTVTISPLPTVAVNSPSVCAGQNATVTATPSPAGNYSYLWTVPSGATNPGNVATFNTNVPGIYSVIATNLTTTCASLSASGTVTINPLPTVTVNSPTVCAGQPATVIATPTPAGTYTYAWTVPTGATNPGNVATFNASVAGSYSVIITDATTTCASLSASGTVTINPLPTVTVNSPSICPGEDATVTATPTPAGNYSYVWTVPTGATNPGDVATFITQIAGTYSVIITNTTTNCPSLSASGTVTINPIPTVVVNNPSICAGQDANVTATPSPAGNYSYVWTVPAGATNPGNVATFATNIPGVYSVIATNLTTNCVSLSASGTVTVNPLPTVTVDSQTVCAGQSATITATPSPAGTYSYAWTVPSGASNPGNVPTFNTTIAGTYSVIITDATTTCASLSASGTVTVNPLPTVTVNSTSVCAGGTATITATPGTPGNYTYTWTVPTGATDPGNVDTFNTTVAGTYSVTLTDVTTTCISASAGTVTINPLPTVTVNNPSICLGLDATITATPSPAGNYSYVWTVPAGATNPGNVATFITSTVGVYSVVVTNLTTTCVSESASGTVSNSALPVVTVNSTSICEGNAATITATPDTGTAADYSYAWTVPTGATNPGNVASFDTTVAGTYSVIITHLTTTCVSLSASGTVTVNSIPTVTVNSISVCSGTDATLTATVGTGIPTDYSYAWTVPTGVTNPGDVASFDTNVGGTYSVIITNLTTNCPSASASGTVTVNPLPTATVSSSGTVCSGSIAAILFTGTPNSTVTYNVNGGANATVVIGASGTFTLNTPLSVTSTFNLVSVVLNNPPSCSQTLTGATTMTVTQPPQAGSNANLTVCSNDGPQDLFLLLGASAQPGGTWSPALASGTNIYNPALDTATSYTYLVAGTPPCVNDTATVFVTVTPAPNAGTNSTANLCSNIDPVDLTGYLGGTPQTGGTWTPALASGTNFFNPAVDLAGVYTYTVNGNGPCGSAQADVTVNITVGPNAGTSNSTTLCVNSPAINLFPLLGPLAETGGTWSPALASGTDLFDPAIDAAGPYTYTLSGNDPCDNDTATVTVTVNPLPDAGENATTDICSNADPIDLITRLAGTPQPGGVWTPALASGTGIFDPAVDAAATYTYTVGNPFCTPDSADLVVNVIPGPDAGGPGAITFCVTDTPQDLFLSLTGTPQAGGTWSPALASGTGVFDPAVDPAADYTYSLSGNDPCDNDTAVVSVTVNPVPDAGNAAPNQDVCNSQGTFDLNSLLIGAQTTGLWTDSNNQSVTSTVDVSTLAPAVYTYTYTITNSCGTDATTVTFTILPNPSLEASNITVSSPNCSGENVTVTFNNMLDGSYVLNYDLSLSNVLTNQSSPVTIVDGTGIMTINANDIPNTGTTRLTFTNITNATTSCTVPINPIVSADFIIRPSSNLDNTNLAVTNLCFGEDATVLIAGATGLADGDYQFVYSLPQATPDTGTTGTVTITSGTGQFTIPAVVLAATGGYTLTITSIVNLSGGCNNLTEDATATFTVNVLPDLSNGTLSAVTSCLNFSNEVILASDINSSLPDGSYNITYELSGAVTATHTDLVTILDGVGTFTIPANDLNTAGNVTVTITQITSVVGLCNAATIGIDPITFEVSPEVETPVLTPNGEKFCAPENPTIANLSSNVTGTLEVVWYDAPTAGTAYASTDLLIDGATYYGSYLTAAGCESVTRLPVTVDLDNCEDIMIPDGFSPNGDGVNDAFVIKNLAEKYPRFTLEIYNRYGNVLYKGDINTPNWDGTNSEGGVKIGGKNVPVGVYFYIVEFNDGTRDPKQGRLYLSR
ncbi:T9SS type B sorting domain-containing protein [Flavobacterium sp. CYK-4]|uniref:gliding motility-associated C-terminal domain-containing protein n=1 Tax=Flavobacterium lotistagni TaxID=2709660 RepID=UPI00140E3FFC|nr:gliding motility-associated C-terminal domain-containing protein [Flavobacterium lotistagni]NHM06211.1 T9SS type B sorting domain-containing protein [Flavobacterium lotistagni]